MISCLKVDQILSKGAVDLVMFFFSFLIFFFLFLRWKLWGIGMLKNLLRLAFIKIAWVYF